MERRTIRSVLNVRKPVFWILLGVIALLILTLCSLPRMLPKKLTVIDSGSEIDGISVSLKEANLGADEPHLIVEWKNESEKTYQHGGAYDIIHWNGFGWESCLTTDNLYFDSVAKNLYYEEDMTCSMEYFNLSRPGKYRILLDNIKEHELWIEFELSVNV